MLENTIDNKFGGDNKPITLKLPIRFAFKDHDILDFDRFLAFFNWDIHNCQVKIDLSTCASANYQALSLLVLYAWRLKSQGCTVSVIETESEEGASAMWRRMGARGMSSVLINENQQFRGNPFKPLFSVRTAQDFKSVTLYQYCVIAVAVVFMYIVWHHLGNVIGRCSRRIAEIEQQINGMAGTVLLRWENEQLGSKMFHRVHRN